jgi:hypothetical protein
LFDALAEHTAAANQISNLRLVKRDLNCAGPNVVCCRVDIEKLCVHGFSFRSQRAVTVSETTKGADRIAAMGALFITYQLDRSAAKWRYLLFYPRLNLCH